MSNRRIPFLEPIPWKPGLVGEFPGQESVMELEGDHIAMVFCWCPPGLSGTESVAITQGFWLAKHPVSQSQWRAVMGDNPSARGKGDECPVDSVSWEDAQKFCGKAGLRLPTEAQWEHACRAGTTTEFGIGQGDNLSAQMANFDGGHPYGGGREAFKWLYREGTLQQGCFPPNAWGLHDMHGQLWEWCEDQWDSVGRDRVVRGGCWFRDGEIARSAFRNGHTPESRFDFVGFRPCPSSITSQAAERDRE